MTQAQKVQKNTHAHETEQGTTIAAQERELEGRRRTHMRGARS